MKIEDRGFVVSEVMPGDGIDTIEVNSGATEFTFRGSHDGVDFSLGREQFDALAEAIEAIQKRIGSVVKKEGAFPEGATKVEDDYGDVWILTECINGQMRWVYPGGHGSHCRQAHGHKTFEELGDARGPLTVIE